MPKLIALKLLQRGFQKRDQFSCWDASGADLLKEAPGQPGHRTPKVVLLLAIVKPEPLTISLEARYDAKKGG